MWDNDSRKIVTQNPTGINLTQTLDHAGNRLVLADPWGRNSYTWDIQSRLTQIQNPLNEVTTIQWDPLNREQHRVLGNGGTISHTFDAAGHETLLENRNAAGFAQAVFTNTYSNLNQRITVHELSGVNVAYRYDNANQFLNEIENGANAHNITYIYDNVANRIQENSSGQITTRKFSAANALLTLTPPTGPISSYSWDAVGNMLAVNTGAAFTTNTWSPTNKLLSTVFSDGTTESYQYSYDGIRKSKTNAGGVTVYTMDDLNILLETNSSTVLEARNTNYPGYYGGLASQNRSGVSSYYGFDSQLSARILVSIAGVVTDNYSYRGFGVQENAGSGTPNPHRFAGQMGYQWDRPNWMIAGQRELDAINGRWASRDSIGMLGGINEYGYVGNEPVMRWDPSGRRPPNAVESALLDKLTNYPIQNPSTNDHIWPEDLGCVKQALLTELGNLEDGQQVPAGLAAVLWAIGLLGDMRYSLNGSIPSVRGDKGIGRTDKCNYFVGNAFAAGGNIDFVDHTGYPVDYGLKGGFSPAPAEWMGNPDPTDPHDVGKVFPIIGLDNAPTEIGEVDAWWMPPDAHHVAIYIGCGMYINASGKEGVIIRHKKYIDDQQQGNCPSGKKIHLTRRHYRPKPWPQPNSSAGWWQWYNRFPR